jgi:hypothetical protein
MTNPSTIDTTTCPAWCAGKHDDLASRRCGCTSAPSALRVSRSLPNR